MSKLIKIISGVAFAMFLLGAAGVDSESVVPPIMAITGLVTLLIIAIMEQRKIDRK